MNEEFDPVVLNEIIELVLQANPAQVSDYEEGEEKLIGFFVGRVMKASNGKANPYMVNKLLKEIFEDGKE